MDANPFGGRERIRDGPRGAGPHRSLRLLVVDDEPAIREILAILLTEEGHRVTTARDGLEALEKFAAGQWDLVITDRAMPSLPGDELAARMKAIAPDTPVILITGFVGPMDPVGPFARAIDKVVKKPFKLTTLRLAIDEVMAGKPAAKDPSLHPSNSV